MMSVVTSMPVSIDKFASVPWIINTHIIGFPSREVNPIMVNLLSVYLKPFHMVLYLVQCRAPPRTPITLHADITSDFITDKTQLWLTQSMFHIHPSALFSLHSLPLWSIQIDVGSGSTTAASTISE